MYNHSGITTSAKSYLKEDAKGWHGFVSALVTNIAKKVKYEDMDAKIPLEKKPPSNLISPHITEALMSPELVRKVIKCKNISQVSNLLCDVFHNDFFNVMAIGGILVHCVTNKVIGAAPPLLSTRHIHASFDRQELNDAVSEIINDQPVHAPEYSGQLVRLDIIDIALYRQLISEPELMKTLDWRVFEKVLADLLNTLGYKIDLQRGTKDGGIDLIALKRDEILGEHRYLLQAKRY